jgi:hypothetical protein
MLRLANELELLSTILRLCYRENRLILGARGPRSKREGFSVFPKLANLVPSLFSLYKVPD